VALRTRLAAGVPVDKRTALVLTPIGTRPPWLQPLHERTMRSAVRPAACTRSGELSRQGAARAAPPSRMRVPTPGFSAAADRSTLPIGVSTPEGPVRSSTTKETRTIAVHDSQLGPARPQDATNSRRRRVRRALPRDEPCGTQHARPADRADPSGDCHLRCARRSRPPRHRLQGGDLHRRPAPDHGRADGAPADR
jgi:hypothetical protein